MVGMRMVWEQMTWQQSVMTKMRMLTMGWKIMLTMLMRVLLWSWNEYWGQGP